MPQRARQNSEISSRMPLPVFADELLCRSNPTLDQQRKAVMGQFMTPSTISEFMASLFTNPAGDIELLDAGAGAGALTAAFIQRCCANRQKPISVTATVYEMEPLLLPCLQEMLVRCRIACETSQVRFTADIRTNDFIREGRELLEKTLFSTNTRQPHFSHVILNPPYKKIRGDGEHRRLLRAIGIETGNLYAAFVAIGLKMLRPGGELVAITPRSFCNGPYFKQFRRLLLDTASIRQIHLFTSRSKAFAHDNVLQENIIFHLVKGADQGEVVISATEQTDFATGLTRRPVPFEQVVKPDDRNLVIHVAADRQDDLVEKRVKALPCTLRELGIEVSTGPVVDFRLQEFLRLLPDNETLPLIYPSHCEKGFVRWPGQGRKPNAIADVRETAKWLFPNGWYVLTRRFSSKEEKRRIVAAVHDPGQVPGERIGFENHLNLFHAGKQGLTPRLAKGLTLFLNSTLADQYFRQFSGHTQVNATDLRMLRYPRREVLERWGNMVRNIFPPQEEIDHLVNKAAGNE